MATTSSVSAVAGPLASIFATNDGFINRSIGGLTEDDLWYRPTDQSNPMFWLLGHVVHTRGAALRIIFRKQLTIAWGFACTYAARNKRIENAVWKVTSDFLDHLLRQVGSAIVHCHHHTQNG